MEARERRLAVFAAWVAAEQGVPLDAQQLEKHVDAIGGDVHFGPRIVGPAHWYLNAGKPVPLGQIQQLRIEAESFAALLLETDYGALAAKCFEAALSV